MEVRGICHKCKIFSEGHRVSIVEFICFDCATQEMWDNYADLQLANGEALPYPEEF